MPTRQTTQDGNTPLSPDEKAELRFGNVTTQRQLNLLEQANIEMGLQWLARRRKLDILSDVFVRELHKKLFGAVWKWAGRYRLTEKNIGIDPLMIAVELRKLLDDARFWLEHETYKPLEQAARLHHRLVQIHPFVNGNGRHARILADVFLTGLHHYPPIDWAGGYDLADVNDERRKAYIAALRAADRGEFGLLMQFVGLEVSLTKS
jgi:Fic-DOC domain mobile mystery protein B